MAETQFESDLKAMFDRAPAAPDAAAFALDVDRRITRRRWTRVALVCGLGLVGLLLTWIAGGFRLADFTPSLAWLQSAPGYGVGDPGLWAAGVLALVLLWAVAQAVLTEA